MKNVSINSLGWLIAAVMGASMLAGGFSQSADKFGMVDLDKVVFESNLGKKNADKLDAAVKSRQGLMDFVSTYRIISAEQLQRLRTLATKPAMNDTEKGEYNKLMQDVKDASKKFDDLNQKTAPTDDDRRLLQEYNTRRELVSQSLSSWNQEFQSELLDMREAMLKESLKLAKDVIKEKCKAQGYTAVFSTQATVYAANDITDDIIKAVDSRN